MKLIKMNLIIKLLVLIVLSIIFLSVQAEELLLTRQELEENLSHLRSKTPRETQRDAAIAVISRILPDHSHLFKIEITKFEGKRSFELIKNDSDPTVLIRATDGVSACKAFYHYLKYYLNSHVSWSGNQLNIPDKWPSIKKSLDSPSMFVYHQNVCTWSYSFTWWTWKDWRRHIDWMAMQGITMTIAPIQEEIWNRVYKDIGLTKDEIDDHQSGPTFLAWLRMGNFRGWGGPLSESYKIQQLQLQKKIIKAQRDLGMTVAIPGFAGHVPIAMKRLYPNVTLTPVNCWNKFTQQYCCPLFVDPTEPLFHEIGTKFISEVIREYGTDHLYFSDPFNEIEPRKQDPEYLAQTSLDIHNAMVSIDPKAIWLLQGWMFVKNPFWSEKLIQSFLTAIPQGRMLVLDLQSEILPQYERTKSYFGQPFIWCMLHNFGGTLGMHGSIQVVNTRVALARNMENSTMIGVGITPEGINQNYPLYEFALERGWLKDNFNITDWFNHYSKVRYGIADKNLEQAWEIITETVYSYRGLERFHGKYIVTTRPSLKRNPWIWYDPLNFVEAWVKILNASESLYSNKLYQHDLIDITRQFLQTAGDSIYLDIQSAFKNKNLEAIGTLSEYMIQVFNDLEKILATNYNFLLGPWLQAAKNMALTKLEEEMYELNSRNQITLWGPDGQIIDYAAKQWSGIIEDYSIPRWNLFLSELKISLKMGKNFNENKFRQKVFKNVEHPFTVNQKIYPTVGHGNTVDIARDIFRRWSEMIDNGYLNLTNIPTRKVFRRANYLTTPTVIFN